MPSRHFEVSAGNVLRNVLPWVQIFDPSFRRLSSGLSHRRIRDQEPQPASQIRGTSALKNVNPAPSTTPRFSGTSSGGTARRPVASRKSRDGPSQSGGVQTP